MLHAPGVGFSVTSIRLVEDLSIDQLGAGGNSTIGWHWGSAIAKRGFFQGQRRVLRCEKGG
jgi:hypothetical protein